MTPASVLAAIPADILRAGDNINQRRRQATRLGSYFEQKGHRPTWLEIINERARRSK